MSAPTGGGKTKAPPFVLPILATASRVRYAALRDGGVEKQSLPKEETCAVRATFTVLVIVIAV